VTDKASRIQAWQSLSDLKLADSFETCPALTWHLVEWAARARVRECRIVAKFDTLGEVQTMCT